MPVRRVETSKGPFYIAEIQTRAEMNVLGDVLAVIEIEELVVRGPTIQQVANTSSVPSSVGF